jgi:hypothetical protein
MHDWTGCIMTTLAPHVNAKRQLAALVIGSALVAVGCTTFVEQTACEPGSTGCAGIHDARFCELVALTVEGKGCGDLGVVASKPFCVVTPTECVTTQYAVEGRDCKVVRYLALRDSARSECPVGTPMFVIE